VLSYIVEKGSEAITKNRGTRPLHSKPEINLT